MTNAQSTVLADGAGDKFVGLVLPELAKRGRHAEHKGAVLQNGANEVMFDDWRDATLTQTERERPNLDGTGVADTKDVRRI